MIVYLAVDELGRSDITYPESPGSYGANLSVGQEIIARNYDADRGALVEIAALITDIGTYIHTRDSLSPYIYVTADRLSTRVI